MCNHGNHCARHRASATTAILLAILVSLLVLAYPAVSFAGVDRWTSIGPASGKVYSVTVSPHYSSDRTMFAAGMDGKVYKTTNGGSTWQTFTVDIVSPTLYSIAVSPQYSVDHTVFAAGNGGAVYKSTDGGATWQRFDASPGYPQIYTVAVSPNYGVDKTAFIGTGDGFKGRIYKSMDGGKTWPSSSLVDSPISSIAISPSYATDRTAFAAANDVGIYKTSDGGQSWTTLPNPPYVLKIKKVKEEVTGETFDEYERIPYRTVRSIAISPNYANDKTLLAGANNDFAVGMVFKTTDSGATWSAGYTGNVGMGFVSSISVSPGFATDKTAFALSTGGVFVSTNMGAGWAAIKTGLTSSPLLSVVVSPGYGTDKSVYVSTWGSGVMSYGIKTPPVMPSPDMPNIGSGGGGGTAPADTIPPAAPKNLRLVSSKGMIGIAWDRNAERDIAGYYIYRRESNASAAKLNSTPVTALAYQDTTAKIGSEYIYYVTAVDRSKNESAPSNELTASLVEVKARVAFKDVPATAWYTSFVSKLVEKKVVGGYPDGTFKPNKTVTRAEYAKMICLAMGWEAPVPATSSFRDVSRSSWASRYVEAAKANGAISGYPDGTFGAFKNITRAEVAAIIARTLDLNAGSSGLSDIRSSWAGDYINSCIAAGIIGGYGDNTFRPGSPTTRAEAAKMIYGMIE